MKTFTIENETNNITVHASAKEAEAVPNSERFSNEAALAKLAANWPAARLVEIWNSLPGETPVKKFKDRATAVSRIWKAIQSLGETAPAAEEPAPVPETAPVAELPETAPVPRTASETAMPEWHSGSQPPATPVAPQTPDVAPAEPRREEEGHPGEKGARRRDRERSWCAARGQQDQPGDRDAQARGRHDAGGDHDRDGLAEAHHPGDAERRRLADEEARAGRNQREGWRQAGVFDQSLSQTKLVPSRRRIQPRRLSFFAPCYARVSQVRIARFAVKYFNFLNAVSGPATGPLDTLRLVALSSVLPARRR